MDKRGQSNCIFRINIITPTTLLVVAIKLGHSDAGDLGKTRLGGLQGPERHVGYIMSTAPLGRYSCVSGQIPPGGSTLRELRPAGYGSITSFAPTSR